MECLPVRGRGGLHTHLNNETITKDVRDNCFYFTSDILKVIAGMLTIIFNRFLLEREEELVRLHNVNRPLPCSECFLLFQPPLQRLWVHSFHHSNNNNVYSTFYLASPVGHPLNSSALFKTLLQKAFVIPKVDKTSPAGQEEAQWTTASEKQAAVNNACVEKTTTTTSESSFCFQLKMLSHERKKAPFCQLLCRRTPSSAWDRHWLV